MRKILLAGLLGVLGLSLSITALPVAPSPTVWGEVLQVLDGNRIVVQISGALTAGWIAGSQETVRYIGSWASGTYETPCGAVATQVNYQMVMGRTVYLEFDQQLRDSDGTLLAYVYLEKDGHAMVNEILVAMGLSKMIVEAPNTRYAEVFQILEAAAYNLGLGCLGSALDQGTEERREYREELGGAPPGASSPVTHNREGGLARFSPPLWARTRPIGVRGMGIRTIC